MAHSIASPKPSKLNSSYKLGTQISVPTFYVGFSLSSNQRELAIKAVNWSEIEALEQNQRDKKSDRINLPSLPFSNEHKWTLRGLLGSMILLAIPLFWKKMMDEEKRMKRKDIEENRPLENISVRIEIPEGALRPIANGWPRKFTTEIGKICRIYAPATFLDWHQIEEFYLDKIHRSIVEKFDIDLHLPHVRLAVNIYIQDKFKSFRYKLYKHFQECGLGDAARSYPFDGISQDDWNQICDLFMTENFQRRRKKNLANQNRQDFKNSEASKSFAESLEKMGSNVTTNSQNILASSKSLTGEEIKQAFDTEPVNILGLGNTYIELEEYQKRIDEVEKEALEAKKQANEAEKFAQELEEKVKLQEQKIEELEEQLRKVYSTVINTDEGMSYTT